ncbi:unnamed protein product [Linum trigynum]|uniref:F-box domain-containing protein n=1 Tax=Linum trigynum TaxID=586398 RepID=A0AAV2C9E4_9ROSI
MSQTTRRDEGAEAKDRVSDLSDDILYHVLSSLRDAKLVVQTSVLSKRWRYLWKDVGVLNLDQNSFSTSEGCRTFLRNFLPLRSKRATVGDMELISFTFNYTRAEIKHGVPLNP